MTRSRTTWWRLLAIFAVFGLIAAACGDDGDGGDESSDTTADSGEEAPEEEAVEPVYGGEITMGLEAESNNWTPGPAQLANSGLVVAGAIYDPLMSLTDEGDFEPFLAESLTPNDDLTEWTMTLREGVMFADDTPLDAEAILWNYETLHACDTCQTKGSLDQAKLTGVAVVDDLTVLYTLSEPNAAFPDVLRGEAGWPVSPTAYEADPEGFTDHPIGTGPFVMESWTRDSETVLVRNDNYWNVDEDGNELPYLDGVTLRPIPDEDSRVQSLASGDLNMMQTLRGNNVKQVQALVEEGDEFTDSFYVGNTAGSAILNVLEPPLDDLRIRQSLALASDAYAVQAVLGDDGLTEPASGFFTEDSPWYSQAAADAYVGYAGRDLEGATALLEEYKADPDRSDGKAPGEDVVVEYNCPPDPSLIQVSQLQQSLWGEAGFVVNLNQVEQAAHISNAVGSADTDPAFRGNYIINCWRAGGGDGDPLSALQSFFGPIATTPGNFTNYTNPEIDELLVTLRTNADFSARYDAVEQIGIISGTEVPILWSSPTPTIVGYTSNIHGIKDWTLPDGALGTGTPGSTVRFHQAFIAQ